MCSSQSLWGPRLALFVSVDVCCCCVVMFAVALCCVLFVAAVLLAVVVCCCNADIGSCLWLLLVVAVG